MISLFKFEEIFLAQTKRNVTV